MAMQVSDVKTTLSPALRVVGLRGLPPKFLFSGKDWCAPRVRSHAVLCDSGHRSCNLSLQHLSFDSDRSTTHDRRPDVALYEAENVGMNTCGNYCFEATCQNDGI